MFCLHHLSSFVYIVSHRFVYIVSHRSVYTVSHRCVYIVSHRFVYIVSRCFVYIVSHRVFFVISRRRPSIITRVCFIDYILDIWIVKSILHSIVHFSITLNNVRLILSVRNKRWGFHRGINILEYYFIRFTWQGNFHLFYSLSFLGNPFRKKGKFRSVCFILPMADWIYIITLCSLPTLLNIHYKMYLL